MKRWLVVAFALAPLARAQSLAVRSQFIRTDPFGEIVRPDRGGKPREILSPAVARNGWASYHFVVKAPPAVPFTVFIGQNPANTACTDLYREGYVKLGSTWYPDKLQRVSNPYTSTIGGAGTIPGQRTQSFWLDLWIPKDIAVKRFRVEVQLGVEDTAVVYPLEFRVQEVTIPAVVAKATPLPPIQAPADVTALRILRDHVCRDGRASGTEPGLTVRHLIRRNALQDMALARAVEKKRGREQLIQRMLFPPGDPRTADFWCRSNRPITTPGTEWYLRVHDYLLTGRYAASSSSITVEQR